MFVLFCLTHTAKHDIYKYNLICQSMHLLFFLKMLLFLKLTFFFGFFKKNILVQIDVIKCCLGIEVIHTEVT